MDKKLKKLTIAIVFILIISVFISIPVLAIDGTYNGSGISGGGKGTSASGGYSINNTGSDTYKNVIGYRFSVYNSNGIRRGDIYDVYNGDWFTGSKAEKAYSSFYAAKTQRTKKDYKNAFDAKILSINTNSLISNLSYNTKAASKCGFYTDLPQNPSKIEKWINEKNSTGKKNNAGVTFSLCGVNAEDVEANDRIVVEPILQVEIEKKVTAITPTELAFLYGIVYDDIETTTVSSKQNTIGFLGNYVLKNFPNLLYTLKDENNLWEGVKAATSVISPKEIITKGYYR